MYAQKYLNIGLKEAWYEKLQRWEEALVAYKTKYQDHSLLPIERIENLVGQMRCLRALGQWEELGELCR